MAAGGAVACQLMPSDTLDAHMRSRWCAPCGMEMLCTPAAELFCDTPPEDHGSSSPLEKTMLEAPGGACIGDTTHT
jgi:hypothetical protein